MLDNTAYALLFLKKKYHTLAHNTRIYDKSVFFTNNTVLRVKNCGYTHIFLYHTRDVCAEKITRVFRKKERLLHAILICHLRDSGVCNSMDLECWPFKPEVASSNLVTPV